MTRRDSVRDRRECFDRTKRTDHLGRIVLDCWICGGVILPASEVWECEHPIPKWFDGTKTMPAHPHCHKPKTAKDQGDIAKVKRTKDKVFGIKKTAGTMPGSRGSKWKKKVDGTTVLRESE